MKTKLITSISIIILGTIFLIYSDQSANTLLWLSSLINTNLTWYYILLGVGFLSIIIYLGLSKYGDIRLGNPKDKIPTLSWAAMIFTSTMAADILFFALHEWIYYYQDASSTYLSSQSSYLVASTYPLFHWGPIAWGFYILPAIAYAYIKYVKNNPCNNLSSAITNAKYPSIINSIGLIGLIAGVSSTYSFTTPLISRLINDILGTNFTISGLSILIILGVGIFYFLATIGGINRISNIANINVKLIAVFLATILLFNNPIETINQSISSLGNLTQNFIGMSTFISSNNQFTQTWTSFYWSYWIAWSIATPFFIATISKGRTIRELALGGLAAGVGTTFLVFSIITNTGITLQKSLNLLSITTDPYDLIVLIMNNLYNPLFAKILLIICMLMLYVSTLDGILYVVSRYCDNTNKMKFKSALVWFLVFTIIPIALLYNNQIMDVTRTLSIIVALPLSLIMIRVVKTLFKFLLMEREDDTHARTY